MEDINFLIKGLDTDSHPLKQKEHTVREMLNFVPLSKDGNLFSITNEDGTELFEKVTFPTSFQIIGYSVLDKDIIVILANSSGNSQVGYVRQDVNNEDNNYGFYHPSAPYDKDNDVYPENNSELGFNLDYPVDCVSRKLIDGHRVLYFTDNFNPYGTIDLDDPPIVGSVKDEVKLTFNQSIPTMRIREIRENVSGSFNPGIYQVVTRYVTDSGGVTNFGIPSNVIPMVPTNRSVGVDNYSGGFNEDGNINKNILVTFDDVDTQYQELEVILIYYEGTQSVFKASIIGQIPINSESIDYTITGIDSENIIDITREELNKNNVTYTKAKCIEQKDNTLFLSNLSSGRQDDYDQLQLAANKTRIGYEIEEIQYSGRGENGQTPLLVFTATAIYLGSISSVSIDFNDSVDETAGVNDVLSNYTLRKQGSEDVGQIEITDNAALLDGDTITIDTSSSSSSQATVVFTAETTATSNNNTFVIDSDVQQTNLNLLNSINDSSDVSDYSAIIDSGVIYLIWNTSTPDSGGTTITSSTTSISTVDFTGYSNLDQDFDAISLEISDNSITANFATSISSANTIRIVSVKSTEGEEFLTGNIDDNSAFTSISLTEPDSSSSSFEVGFTDYLNEELTFTSKTYRRNEVYSFGFNLLYNDGTTSPVFHIPGNKSNVDVSEFNNGINEFPPLNPLNLWGSYNTGETSGELGTYVSEETYPNEQNYPGNENGDDNTEQGELGIERNIRHHLMPSLENEPHFREENGVTFLRLINLEFNLDLSSVDLSDVQKVIFVRERRSNSINKSVYAQGIVNKQAIMADNYDNSGYVDGEGGDPSATNPFDKLNSGYFAAETPFANNITGFDFVENGADSDTLNNRGFVFPNYLENGNPIGSPFVTVNEFLKNRCNFYSPETILFTGFRFNPGLIEQGFLKQCIRIKGDYNFFNELGLYWGYDSGRDNLKTYPRSDLFADYNNYYTESLPNPLTPLRIENARYLEPGVDRAGSLDPLEKNIKTSSRWNTSSLEMKLENDLYDANTDAENLTIKGLIRGHSKLGNTTSFCFEESNTCIGSVIEPNLFKSSESVNAPSESFIARHLYNVKTNNLSQYGQITQGSFIPISIQKPINEQGNLNTVFNKIYGGDTFITKFSYNNTSLVPYWPPRRKRINQVINRPDQTNVRVGYFQIDGINKGGSTSGGPGKAHGFDYRTCNYYFVESEINTYYRHRPKEEEKQNYFPNENNLSSLLNDFVGYLDNIRAYNAQYSYENNVRQFFVRGSTEAIINKFENRTIYSETAANDDTLDSYRSFLVNNYYDLPSNTGPIWDSFVSYNRLFLHTTKSLWSTFAEPSATLQGGNISDVVLGTGRLFQRPSQEVLTTEGGYAGTISQWGGSNTRIGYVFPDVLQGKVFGLVSGDNGPYLKELSEVGSQTFFKENLAKDLIEIGGFINEGLLDTPNLIDNPFNKIGLFSTYDQNLKRFIIIKHGTTPISRNFSVINQQWSNHSYIPNVMIAYNNQLFFYDSLLDNTSRMWEMNKGRKGEYFGEFYDSKIEFICNVQMMPKVFKNLFISSESTDENGKKVRDDCFHLLQAFTDRQNTFEVKLVQGNTFNKQVLVDEVVIKFRNDEYRLAIPRDSVIDNDSNIFDELNRDFSQKFRERIKGDYAHFVLTYNNTENNYEFVVNSIKTKIDLNAR